jgi:cellulose synthase/poly-beta-1,6-N-acetylglucosamine synthase-like glycosyltransferase
MELLWQILFWVSGGMLLYSYGIFPWWLGRRARGRQLITDRFSDPAQGPRVSVLMAVHNEERVLVEKLESLLAQTYPADRYTIWVGSDCSTDGTNDILARYAAAHSHLHFIPFTQRQGKPGVVNHLAAVASEHYPISAAHVFLITDASVILRPGVVWALVRHFRQPDLAIVDAHMQHTGMKASDISRSENQYISREVRLKYHESVLWQYMIGPFGGCYALRSDYFEPIPDNFLVDDFFLTMRAFERGGHAINELTAVCYEPVGHELREEFRRKARISAGNFQNLIRFRHLWWPPFGVPNGLFFSHKVLRWLGPFFILLLLVAAVALCHNLVYGSLLLILLTGFILVPLLDVGLRRFGLHWMPLRHIRYFLMMNLALLVGFFRYLKGIKTNVWQPPKRYAED